MFSLLFKQIIWPDQFQIKLNVRKCSFQSIQYVKNTIFALFCPNVIFRCIYRIKKDPLFPIVSRNITCRICKFVHLTLKLHLLWQLSMKWTRNNIFLLFFYFIYAIKNVEKRVKFKKISWNSHPCPATRVRLISF